MRLFIAVWPPDHVLEALGALERPAVEGVRWTTPDQWHITLRFLGELADPVAADAGRGTDAPTRDQGGAAAAVVAARLRSSSLPAAEAVMGPASECGAPGVLWLPVAGLDPLAAAVTDATHGIGRRADGPFRGHLTLARARRGARRGVLGTLAPLVGAAAWTVREVAVVESTLGGSGSRYEVLDRVGLGP